MQATESYSSISRPVPDAVNTRSDMESSAKRSNNLGEAMRARWQAIIDRQLIEWGRDPSQFDDEGVEPPARETIQLAINLAQALSDARIPPPDSVILDPNGGIVFERREHDVSEVFHVWDDGAVEYQRFRGTQLVERWNL